jgi:L-fuconolactonase
MKKRKDGRNETIVEPDLPIIDAHHHLLDRGGVRYLFDDLRDDISAGHNIQATVYIESHSMMRDSGPELLRPVGETEFANGAAAMSASGNYGPCRINAAIISFANLLAGDAVAETLDAHSAAGGSRFRGIRQVGIWHSSPEPYQYMASRPEKDVYANSQFRKGFARLAERGLTFDAAVFHHQLGDVAALADAFPDTPIILNHLGFAMAMGMDEAGRKEVFADWRKRLGELARRANISAKIGGLGMPFWGFGFDQRDEPASYSELAQAWRPYVEVGIEIFGSGRCMMESNFPADGFSCGYVPLWNALKTITLDYSPDEKRKLYMANAARIYRIESLPA